MHHSLTAKQQHRLQLLFLCPHAGQLRLQAAVVCLEAQHCHLRLCLCRLCLCQRISQCCQLCLQLRSALL